MTERQACLDQHETMQLLVHVNLSLCNLFLTHAADPTPTTAGGVYHSIRRMPLISRETAQQLTIRIKKSKSSDCQAQKIPSDRRISLWIYDRKRNLGRLQTRPLPSAPRSSPSLKVVGHEMGMTCEDLPVAKCRARRRPVRPPPSLLAGVDHYMVDIWLHTYLPTYHLNRCCNTKLLILRDLRLGNCLGENNVLKWLLLRSQKKARTNFETVRTDEQSPSDIRMDKSAFTCAKSSSIMMADNVLGVCVTVFEMSVNIYICSLVKGNHPGLCQLYFQLSHRQSHHVIFQDYPIPSPNHPKRNPRPQNHNHSTSLPSTPAPKWPSKVGLGRRARVEGRKERTLKKECERPRMAPRSRLNFCFQVRGSLVCSWTIKGARSTPVRWWIVVRIVRRARAIMAGQSWESGEGWRPGWEAGEACLMSPFVWAALGGALHVDEVTHRHEHHDAIGAFWRSARVDSAGDVDVETRFVWD
ncbi:hypothetical protein KC348_g92 [Hortaea werneckii]|nr:hypothetical protein KC348_g92 [Hortaea werneckii]